MRRQFGRTLSAVLKEWSISNISLSSDFLNCEVLPVKRFYVQNFKNIQNDMVLKTEGNRRALTS